MYVYLGEESLFSFDSQKGPVEPLPPEELRVLNVSCFFEVDSSI